MFHEIVEICFREFGHGIRYDRRGPSPGVKCAHIIEVVSKHLLVEFASGKPAEDVQTVFFCLVLAYGNDRQEILVVKKILVPFSRGILDLPVAFIVTDKIECEICRAPVLISVDISHALFGGDIAVVLISSEFENVDI